MEDPNIVISPEFLKLITKLDGFKGKWSALNTLSPERLGQLRRVATVESIGSSTRIEGAKLSDSDVEALLSNISIHAFESRDEQEVAGYHEAMDLIFQAWEDIPITENHIKQLHQTLLRHSSKDARHRGEYKKLRNDVMAFDAEGNELGMVFETSSPFDTPKAMADLVAWTSKAITEESLHPLLVTGIFIVVFLAIHPFQDGNGRLSRILTTLMLLRTGYTYVPYSSLERVIEENKDLYYKALRRTQATLNTASPDWEPWLGFFLRCLNRQKSNLERKIEMEGALNDSDLPVLALAIMALLKNEKRTSKADIIKATGANENTVKKYLQRLVKEGRIQQHGKGRATWYTRGRA